MFNEHGKKQSLDQLLKSDTHKIWETALLNELRKLAQGIRNVIGNNVITFIPYKEVP